jgi:sugar lactone lactonase YvrE
LAANHRLVQQIRERLICSIAATTASCGKVKMNGQNFAGLAAFAFSVTFATTLAFSQTEPPAGKPQSPGWFLSETAPDPGGRLSVGPSGRVASAPGGQVSGAARGGPLSACTGDTAKYCAGQSGVGARACLTQNSDKLSSQCKTALAALPAENVPGCGHSPVCDNRHGPARRELQRVEWKQTMGFTYAYPIDLPEGGGGVSAVRINSKGDFWVFQRNAAGKPQLFEFDPNYKLIRTVGEDVIGHQDKAHGMAIDAQDNVWICDANGATVEEISPQGQLIMTIGVRGHRGDWDEAKGQRLLWQPLDLAFASNGDIYIGEGHSNESPNDTDSDDPTNNIGAARVIHLDKNGKFINQWYGNSVGPGKFSMVHGIAVDPQNGDVWLGDREQYRMVVYTQVGKFVRTIQMRNLMCAIAFDPHGNLWVATGQDGQLLKIDRDGNVLGAIGNGSGTEKGQFIEASYMAMDSQGNLYSGDTSVGRITELVAPKK